mgnify:CR=1 FL=1
MEIADYAGLRKPFGRSLAIGDNERFEFLAQMRRDTHLHPGVFAGVTPLHHLPDGVQPRRVTVQVLDAPGGKTLGMRVMLVK